MYLRIIISIITIYISAATLFAAAPSAKGATAPVSEASALGFTALEQQQISIETPGLFQKSNAFQIDFTKSVPYSFPLPVGKVIGVEAQTVDIETSKGDAVKAMFDGTVRLSRNVSGYGNVIVIRHISGLETVYAHNAQNLVKVGDKVKAGQTVAIVGTNGLLNFSIMVNGNKVNPSTIIDVNAHALRKQIITVRKQVGNKVKLTVKRSKDDTDAQAKTKKKALGSVSDGTAVGQSATAPKAPSLPGRAGGESSSLWSKAVSGDTWNLDHFTANPSSWHYPLDKAHVISGYGGGRNHAGVDIKNGPGTNVYAAFDGKVVQSGNFSGYGKCITIQHPNGLETRYSHNSKNFVVVGDQVKAGQVIGIVGRTGRATTEHVHFETRYKGRAFDPAYVFDHARNALQKGKLKFNANGRVVRLK